MACLFNCSKCSMSPDKLGGGGLDCVCVCVCVLTCICVCYGPHRQVLAGPCVGPGGLLRDSVVGLLSFIEAAVNMTGCLETICLKWPPHGNRELELRDESCSEM